MCLLCFYRFSELPEAVLGDFLLNGRCDGMSRTKERAKGRKTGIQICQPTFEVPIKMPAKNRFNSIVSAFKPQHISKRINSLPFYVIQSSISLSLEVQPCIKNELTFRNRRHHRLVRKRGSKLTVKPGTKRQISLHQGTT